MRFSATIKMVVLALAIAGCSITRLSAQVSSFEYFFDADPGFGNGTQVSSGFTPGSSVSFTMSVAATGLTPGFHQLCFRAKSAAGFWGHYQARPVYVTTFTAGNGNIAAAEYFYDTDPGVGQGTNIAIAGGATVNQTVALPVTGLATGFHQLYLRVKNNNGIWSHYQSRTIFVSTLANGNGDITGAEYFFDQDPGNGNGTALALTSGSTVNHNVTIAVGNLAAGFHQLYIRTRNTSNTWSHYQTTSFVVTSGSNTNQKIAGAEYFMDVDPGVGSGTPIAINPPANSVDQTFTLPLSGNPAEGTHKLVIRVKNEQGQWGHYQTQEFNVKYPKPGSGFATVFDGSDDYAAAAFSVDGQPNTFTYELWVNPASTIQIVTPGTSGITGTSGQKYVVEPYGIGNNSDAGMGISVGTNGVQVFEHASSYLPALLSWEHPVNGWTHIAVVYNNKQPFLYVNGVLVATGLTSTRDNVFPFVAKATEIGRGDYGYYAGKADELRIWNTALSQTEIRDWMCKKLKPSHPEFSSLAGSFNMDEGMGNASFDDFKGGKLSFINGAAFEISGAAIGDVSAYSYAGATASATLAHPTRGDGVTATLNSGLADGIQIYCVTDTPNHKAGTTCLGDNNGYFGVFAANDTNASYNAVYNYSGISMSGFNESQIRLYTRADNGAPTWTDGMATLDTAANTATIAGTPRGEYIISNAVVSPTITITASPSVPVCPATPVTFTTSTLNGGTSPAYQWKKNANNISGATAAAYTDTTLINGDLITCELTSNSSCVSPATALSPAFTAVITNALIADVTITPAPASTICAGTQVTFTATPINGGAAPVYQWKINGLAAGGNASTFTSSTFAEGDIITCDMSTNATCAGPALVTSVAVAMQVNPVLTPTIAITATGGNTICSSTPVTFTAAVANGGTTPAYQWKKNGNNVGGNAAIYTDSSLNNNDVVSCALASNATCANPVNVVSAGITMNVSSSATPAITIASNSGTAICMGTSVSFTASVTNGGTTPVYQWKKNGNPAGTNAATYTDNSLANNDTVTCELVSSSSCASPTNAVSNVLAMTVNQFATPSVIIATPANSACAGTPVTFTATATNGGEAPSFQWKKNGLNVGSNNAAYTDPALASTDIITCELTTSLACATQPSATSNSISLNINALPVANAGIDQTMLRGSSVVLTANGGGTYHWSTGDTTASIIVSPATTTTYVVEVMNAGECIATDTVVVTVNFSSLTVAPGSFHFGDVVMNATATTNIVVTNNGTLPETISGASISAPFSTGFTTQSIAPNASVSIPVSFTPAALLIYQQTLTINTSTGNFSVIMEGRGVSAAPSWIITPTSYAFGNVPLNDSMTYTLQIHNTGNVPVDISSIISNNPVFTASTITNNIPVGGQAALSVKMKPAAIAAYSGSITISANTVGLTPLTLNVTGNGYVPDSPPILQFVTAAPYNGTSGVDMTVAPARAFSYRILYKNLSNTPPMSGFPKLGIDVNGDGDFIDAGEGLYSMSKVGATNNWTAGEVFTYTQNLPVGSSYGYRFFANDSLGNTAVAINTAYVAGPLVTNQGLDLSIYANDITFSNNNPAVGQQFTVSAVVHNNSPYSASNVPIRFYKDSVFLTSTTLPYIGANTTATITQNFSFSPDGFYPIKVWIDSANTLAENNPLNNYAIRPVIVGNFSIPGTINIASSANTQSCPEPAVSISGTAAYSGLNLVGNPPVLGATVTVQITNGPTLTTNTVTGGNWSVYYNGFGCGQVLGYTVTVTDYTLANTTGTASFNAPCQSCGYNPSVDYAVHYDQAGPSGCIVENTSFNYTISYLNHCSHDTLHNDTTYVYADNILAFTHTNATIAPCITTAYNDAFSLTAGNHTLSYTNVYYDTAGRHQTSNSLTVNVEQALPDLTLGYFTQTNSTSLTIRDQNNVCVNAGPHKVFLYDSLAGNAFVLLDSFVVNSVGGQSYQLLNYTNPALQMGYHYLKFVTDVHEVLAERNETNNELNALLYVPYPELSINNIVASASNISTGNSMNFSATIRNTGSTAANFKVQFYADGSPIGNRNSIAGLAANASAVVVSNVFTVPAGDCPIAITAMVDADHEINELLETNNTDSINFSTDLVAGVSCSGVGSSCNPYVVVRNLTHHFATMVSNTGKRDAGAFAVKFALAGNRIGSDQITGITSQNNAATGVDYAFSNPGNYVINVTADSANAICEAFENNNTGAIYVSVVEGLPDLEVLSQHISPSNLNPNPNQSITVVASVFNNGTQKSKPGMVRFMVDNVQLGADVPIDTLYPGRDTSVIATVTYSSPTVGPKIIKVIADALDDNLELRENNNEATRAIIVGGAPDFAHSRHEAITFSKSGFRKGQTIDIRNYIRNYGGDSGTAWLRYFVTSDAGIKTLIDSVRFTLHSNDSTIIAKSWIVNMVGHGRITTEVAHSNPMEFDEFNNTDSLDFIAGPELNIASLNTAGNAICENSTLNIGYSIVKDSQPVTFEWHHNGLSTGNTSNTAYIINSAALSDSGDYELYATDSFGTEKSPVKNMIVNPVLVPTVTIAARPGTVICKGNWVKFITMPVNGGAAPAYQWKKNGAVIAGATRAYFIDSLVSNGDQLSCVMISNEVCTSTIPVSSNTLQMTVNGLSNSLASGNASQTNDNDSGMYFNYTDNSCQLIATVSTDSLTDLGLTTATTNIDAAFYGFVQRSVEITPTNNRPATVKLYFNQSEFDAYNTSVGAAQIQLPSSPTDPAVDNIVIYQFHGLPTSGTTGPGGRYDATNVSVIAAANITKVWNPASGYWEISFPVNGFSGHYLRAESIVPLAIRIRDIAAVNKGPINEVSWQTLQESGGDYFELERSANGRDFYKIARINANGNPSPYTYMDNEPVTGSNYYHLKMYEPNGRYAMSKVVTASVKQGVFSIDAFPNPAKSVINLIVHEGSNNGHLQLTDITGSVIRSMNAGGNKTVVELNNLAVGIYFIKYTDDLHSYTVRVVKE